jgi:type IV pilus assembly protein PilE
MENAQYMERYFTTHNTYNDTVTPDPPVLPKTTTKGGSYNISFLDAGDGGTDPNATSYTLHAEPAGGQTADNCGTLTINQLGNKGAAQADCW